MPSLSKPAEFSLDGKSVYVAGHLGMVGSALLRRLKSEPVSELLTAKREHLDLTVQADVQRWMTDHKPDVVFLPAAKVGGIHANQTYPAEFIYDNLMIEANVIHAAYLAGVKKLLFLGSSCIYPKLATQPITEDALLSGPLEPTNQFYAVAKIAGIKLCQAYREQYGCDFISVMPTNLFGPNDNFHLDNSHVIPALMRKIHIAKKIAQPHIRLWGSGSALREFLYVDDCADALVFAMKRYSALEQINVGSGADISILDLCEMIMDVVGYKGEILSDPSKPDGTPRKLLNSQRLHDMGWQPVYSLREGLEYAYKWFLEHEDSLRGVV